jgi:hypothetical protein
LEGEAEQPRGIEAQTRMPSRRVDEAEALAWLEANPAPPGACVVTSLPDVSEISPLTLDEWRAWFIATVRRIVRWVPDDGVAIFYQSDIRLRGTLIDKGYLVMRGAEDERAQVLWHKIVCRKPPGTYAFGRPSYSHMIALSRIAQDEPRHPGPDVLPDAGAMSWSRAMGLEACRVACRYLRDDLHARVIVDPFCGRGSVLAVANDLGMDAIGVELSGKRCRAARSLSLASPSRVSAADAFAAGGRLFDAGRYWDAHEAWEDRWRVAKDEEKRALQGLIQIAAALHKLHVMNAPEPALRLFTRGLTKLDGSPQAFDLDLRDFRARVEAYRAQLETGALDGAAVPRLLP